MSDATTARAAPPLASGDEARRSQFTPSASASTRKTYEIVLGAGACHDRRELEFYVLNRTIAAAYYDRAVLFERAGGKWRCRGVSGGLAVDPRGETARRWSRVLSATRNLHTPQRINAPRDAEDAWEALAAQSAGLSVLWLPIVERDGAVQAGLWLERWGTQRFEPEELATLAALARGYALAWSAVCGKRWDWRGAFQRRRTIVAGALAIVAALVFIQLPLRIVAPCEVVPAEPVVVAAPLRGVIEAVRVLPGRRVAAGDVLAVYDRRVAMEELEIARRQLALAEANLQRARMQAFDEPRMRAQLVLLENRAEQERTRLAMAERRAALLEIRAPTAGVVMLSDPEVWRGRPVQIGERIMRIVDPDDSKLRIWLPESDQIAFDAAQPAKVVLSADPAATRTAQLTYVANTSELDEHGAARFRAEAEWLAQPPGLKLGAKGTAILRGESVALGYWLVRKPLRAVRNWLGV